MGHYKSVVFVLILFSLLNACTPWTWFSPSSKSQSNTDDSGPFETLELSGDIVSEFSIDALDDEKGIERVKNVKTKLVSGSKSCWHDAYQGLFAKCSDISDDDNEKRKRFAWDLSNCFQKDSGRSPYPSCQAGSPMKECLQKLDNNAIHTYREFFLETNSICHQLQSHAFRYKTEKLVNDLKNSANYAEEKLESIEEKSNHLLHDTNHIHDFLTSIGEQTQQLSKTSKNVSDQIGDIVKQSNAVYEQSNRIADSQSELQKGQDKMKETLEEGMIILHESYSDLGKEINMLHSETVDIEKKISKVGNEMSEKMNNLQSKAEEIGDVAGISLDKQKELLKGQSEALDGLSLLSKFQSQALEESRSILQQVAKLGHEQQEELLRRQEQLKQAHDHLVENSQSILSAQEAFEQKQASMFLALDKLFALHNALLVESRLIKAFFIYSILIFLIYMFTGTRQTCTARPKLYIGLCATFLIEYAVLRYLSANDIQQVTWIINIVRLLFVLLAVFQILYSIYTFRDYERLNHGMLENIYNKVNSIHQMAELTWDSDSDEDWSTWVDTDVSDGVDNIRDSDDLQMQRDDEKMSIGEYSNGSGSITRRYNLRRHHCR